MSRANQISTAFAATALLFTAGCASASTGRSAAQPSAQPSAPQNSLSAVMEVSPGECELKAVAHIGKRAAVAQLLIFTSPMMVGPTQMSAGDVVFAIGPKVVLLHADGSYGISTPGQQALVPLIPQMQKDAPGYVKQCQDLQRKMQMAP